MYNNDINYRGVSMKKCSCCKEWKEESEFGNFKASKDGLNYYCRLCMSNKKKKYISENKEKHRASCRRRYLRVNAEKIRLREIERAERKKTEKETARDKFRLRYKRNAEKYRAKMREYRLKNAEKYKEYRKNWSRKNKEKTHAHDILNKAVRGIE